MSDQDTSGDLPARYVYFNPGGVRGGAGGHVVSETEVKYLERDRLLAEVRLIVRDEVRKALDEREGS